MVKAEPDAVTIKTKEDMYNVVQRYLANCLVLKQLEDEMKKQSEAIKKAREKFKLPKGPAEEFDGPNGGITFGSQDREDWCPEMIKKYLGKNEFVNCTEIKVKSASKDHLRALIKQMIEDGKLFQTQADEIYKKTGETIKLIAVPGRAREREE